MFFDCICALIFITAKTKTKDIQKKNLKNVRELETEERTPNLT